MFGCFAYAGAPLQDTEDLESRDYIQLYSNDSNTDIDSCPNENAKKVHLKFVKSKNLFFGKDIKALFHSLILNIYLFYIHKFQLGLVRDSADTFDVPVFQITGSTQVTFQCTVRVYELDQTLPVCPTSRRRRDADDDIVESESKRKNFTKRDFILNSHAGAN